MINKAGLQIRRKQTQKVCSISIGETLTLRSSVHAKVTRAKFVEFGPVSSPKFRNEISLKRPRTFVEWNVI